LAPYANQFSVFAAISTEGIAPRHSEGQKEQNEAPGNSYTPDLLSGDVSCVFCAAWAR